jgi:hypothetical protein
LPSPVNIWLFCPSLKFGQSVLISLWFDSNGVKIMVCSVYHVVKSGITVHFNIAHLWTLLNADGAHFFKTFQHHL